ncbi:MAG: bifunctional riboflavin kinase/FAD synthetase [Bacteriovoracaceae bacterium]|nr:bifunctional riboflavin kinase/FAD synthetase [Bacteriovoracaceae bacterium]
MQQTTIQVPNSLKQISSERPILLTIGNFDGVHLGHQHILKHLKKECIARNFLLVVMTFFPHPQEILGKVSDFSYLCSRNEKFEKLKFFGADEVVAISFNRDFSTMGPATFLEDYVLVHDKLKKLALGHDFSFGANKTGTHQFVQNYFQENKTKNLCQNIELEIMSEFRTQGDIVSSSKIRKFLFEGNIKAANTYLGYGYSVRGPVIKGDGRGRTIGFPTANIDYAERKCLPGRGVYITQTKYKENIFHSVTNIGLNPTFLDQNILRVETHILDFEEQIYGEFVEVKFLDRLRSEVKFQNKEELIFQINEDVKKARNYFQGNFS